MIVSFRTKNERLWKKISIFVHKITCIKISMKKIIFFCFPDRINGSKHKCAESSTALWLRPSHLFHRRKNRREMNATFEHFSANDLAHVMSILTLTKTVWWAHILRLAVNLTLQMQQSILHLLHTGSLTEVWEEAALTSRQPYSVAHGTGITPISLPHTPFRLCTSIFSISQTAIIPVDWCLEHHICKKTTLAVKFNL